MGNERPADLLLRKPRVFWGRVIEVLIQRGWSPPPPDERIVQDLIDAMNELPSAPPNPLIKRIEANDRYLGLTPAERAVCVLLVEGLTNDEMAERMNVAPQTIKFHLTNIYRKLGVNSRGKAVRELMDDNAAA